MSYKLSIAIVSLLTFPLLAAGVSLGQEHPQPSSSQTDSSSRATAGSARKPSSGAAGRAGAQPAPEAIPAGPDTASPAPTATPSHTVAASSSEIIGSLTGGNVYENPALGITLQLTGEWQFMDAPTLRTAEGLPAEEASKAQPKSQCKSLVCGEPEINVGLSTELNPTIGASSVFVAGFRLAPQFLDRKQYPLKMFAEIMLPHSSGGQGAQAVTDNLADIQLGGRPAHRLLVRQPGEGSPREAGYVVESNGYMVLLVGLTSEAADLPKLQQQIEAATFK